MRESDYQSDLIKRIKNRFPGCMVLKTDPTYIQGIPDLLILHNNTWASLECKIRQNARKRPNQPYYIQKMNKMSYSSFIYPENEDEVLNEMEQSFERYTKR